MGFDARDILDQRIDAALASYAEPPRRWGLESRIVRRVRPAQSAARFAVPKWAWAMAGMSAVLALTMFAPRVMASVEPSAVGQWCERLQQTTLSVSLRESLYMWWFVEGGHLLALAIMLGPALMLDLRLLGWLWTRDAVSKVEARFLPITITGFALVIFTGVLLFISEPVRCYESVYFRVKIGLILLAGLNAMVFHATVDRRRAEWDTVLPPPPGARWAGLLGLILWTAVIFAGRYMAYSFSQ
jgi:hypothetical protein